MERDINNIIGFSIAASDGVIGKLEEFYFDDKTWKIRYLIVRTKTPLNSRKVGIPLKLIRRSAAIWKCVPPIIDQGVPGGLTRYSGAN